MPGEGIVQKDIIPGGWMFLIQVKIRVLNRLIVNKVTNIKDINISKKYNNSINIRVTKV